MARKSKAVFKMAGYTYPGTTPMMKKAGPEEKEDNKEVEASLLGGIVGSIKNVGAKRRMKKRTK